MPTGIPMLSRAFKKSADKPITNNTANGLGQQVPQNKEQEPISFQFQPARVEDSVKKQYTDAPVPTAAGDQRATLNPSRLNGWINGTK